MVARHVSPRVHAVCLRYRTLLLLLGRTTLWGAHAGWPIEPMYQRYECNEQDYLGWQLHHDARRGLVRIAAPLYGGGVGVGGDGGVAVPVRLAPSRTPPEWVAAGDGPFLRHPPRPGGCAAVGALLPQRGAEDVGVQPLPPNCCARLRLGQPHGQAQAASATS